MLRKLIKHEFRATGRVMLPMYLILLATAVGSNLAGRWMIDSDSTVVSLLGALIFMAFGFAIFGVCVVAFVMMIQRFYKNLLQDEGYLMFTLPVSVHQHIWAKVIVSAVWFAGTILSIILASLIVAYDVAFMKDFIHFLGEVIEGLRLLRVSEALNGTVILVELVALCFLALVAFSLQFYAALAAGHSRANHKMVWSVAMFFVFQFLMQFFGTLLMMGLDRLDFFELHWVPAFVLDIDLHPVASIHVGLLLMLAGVVIYGAIYYTVTTFFLKRHLNLE